MCAVLHWNMPKCLQDSQKILEGWIQGGCAFMHRRHCRQLVAFPFQGSNVGIQQPPTSMSSVADNSTVVSFVIIVNNSVTSMLLECQRCHISFVQCILFEALACYFLGIALVKLTLLNSRRGWIQNHFMLHRKLHVCLYHYLNTLCPNV